MVSYEWNTPYETQDHKITLCDASTGHTMRTVAMCENAETARVFVELINKALDRKAA